MDKTYFDIRNWCQFAPLHEGDIRFAFDRGWFAPADCVRIFLEWPNGQCPLSDASIAISLLLSDELDRVPLLMESVTEPTQVHSRRYLLGAMLWQADFRDGEPADVEDIYELFGYDIALLPLVMFQGFDAPKPRDALREFVLRERSWAETRLSNVGGSQVG